MLDSRRRRTRAWSGLAVTVSLFAVAWASRSSAAFDAPCFLIMIALETAIQRWKGEDLILLPAIEESVIMSRLSDLGRACSSDVLALYRLTGGMEGGDSDSHMFTLWSFQKVIAETARYIRPYILFADFLIDSHLYGFRYENQERSSVIVDYVNGEEPEVVAESVEEFFKIFNCDAAKLGMFA